MTHNDEQRRRDADKIGVQDVKDQTSDSYLPPTVTQAEVNERNRRYWEQPGGDMFPNLG